MLELFNRESEVGTKGFTLPSLILHSLFICLHICSFISSIFFLPFFSFLQCCRALHSTIHFPTKFDTLHHPEVVLLLTVMNE